MVEQEGNGACAVQKRQYHPHCLSLIHRSSTNSTPPPEHPNPPSSKPPLHPPTQHAPSQPLLQRQSPSTSAFALAPAAPSSTDEETHPNGPLSRISNLTSDEEDNKPGGAGAHDVDVSNVAPPNTVPRRTTTPSLRAYTSTGLPVLLRTTTSTERFGSAVPALAIPRSGKGTPQAVLLYMGVIDFLQPYV